MDVLDLTDGDSLPTLIVAHPLLRGAALLVFNTVFNFDRSRSGHGPNEVEGELQHVQCGALDQE
jgi:hypothetical protein